jgi:precorrin-2 methylase
MTKTGGTYPVNEGKANSRQILHQVHENEQRLQRASAPVLTTEESQQTQLQADTASHIRKKAQAGKSISNHVNKQRIQQLSRLLIPVMY